GFGVAWVISAATAGQIVASRAWGESSAPFLFLEALMYGGLKVLIYSILVLVALLALLMCVAYVFALVSGSTSAFKKVSRKLTPCDLYSGRITAVMQYIR
uniref:Uncharacterized protein n=1 Tax=Aegilops tauschii subsp. strangulata TaxID=200361 RepID=A0A453ARU6_AEGTS